MNPNMQKILGTLVAAVLGVLSYYGVDPVPNELSAALAGLFAGKFLLKQPGTEPVPTAPKGPSA